MTRPTLFERVAAAMAGALASAAAVALGFLLLFPWIGPFAVLGAVIGYFTALLIAVPHALLLGLPLHALISRYRRPGWIAATLSGFAIGGAPIALGMYAFHLPFRFAGPDAPTLQLLEQIVAFGGAGAVAGFFFWRQLRKAEAA